MTELGVTLKFISPAFIGGADNENMAEFRLSELKGLLRFWWRAGQNTDNEQELYNNESDVFGSTEKKSNLSIFFANENTPAASRPTTTPSSRLAYLGYGPIGRGPQRSNAYLRPCIAQDATVDIGLRLRFDREEVRMGFYNSLWLLTHLGGLGSRSRRGFGSVQCASVKNSDSRLQFTVAAKTVDEFAAHLEMGLGEIFATSKPKSATATTLPAYSCLSSLAKICLFPGSTEQVFKSWEAALEAIAGDFLDWRSNRDWRSNKSRVQPPNTVPGADYRLVCGTGGLMDTGTLSQAPNRIAFGLPHNYFSSSRFRNATTRHEAKFHWHLQNKEGVWEEFERRASPLMLHVAELAPGDGRERAYCVVVTWLRSKLLPDGAKIAPILPVKRDANKQVLLGEKKAPGLEPPPDQTVGDFLDHLQKQGKVREVKLPT